MCSTENRVYLAAVDPVHKLLYWQRPDCHLWSCEDCAEINKRRWTAIVAHGIEQYQAEGITDWRFVTITSHERAKTFYQTLWLWRENWPKLSQRMRRTFPSMRYVYLPEKHVTGRLHMHGLMSGGMSTRWLKDNGRECGFGYKNESTEVVSVGQACSYCLKYITKSLTERAYWPKSLHRIRTSQKWPKSLETPVLCEIEATFKPIKALDWLERSSRYIREGYKLIDVRTGEVEGVQF